MKKSKNCQQGNHKKVKSTNLELSSKVMEDKQGEIWKDIHMAPGYQISSSGRVRSVDRIIQYKNGSRRKHKGRVLTYTTSNSGYKRAHIYIERVLVKTSIHRLVAIEFIPNPDNMPQVNHIDENKMNNNVENLEWCTSFENMRHSYEKIQKGINKSRSTREFVVISPSGAVITSRNLTKFSKNFGVSRKCMARVIDGIQKSHRGWMKYEG